MPFWRAVLAGVAGFYIGLICEALLGPEWERPATAAALYTMPLLYWLYYARSQRFSLPQVLGKWNVRSLPLAVVACLACLGVNLGWVKLLMTFDALPSVDISVPTEPAPLFLLGLAICLIGPLAEEILFRGGIFPQLPQLSKRIGLLGSALLSSALFGVMHFNQGGAFLMGLVMVGLYVQTRSLWAPFLAHALNNTLAFQLEWGLELLLSNTWLLLALQAVCIPWLVLFFRRSLRELRALEAG